MTFSRVAVAGFVFALAAVGQNTTTLPGGVTLAVRLEHSINAAHSHAGDTVRATLLAPVVSHGNVLVPRHALIDGRVLAANARRKGSASRLMIRFESARWGGLSVALNAYMFRQLVLRRTVTRASGSNPCPSISRFDLFQRRDRDPSSFPQTPKVSAVPCEGRIGTTTTIVEPERMVFVSPPLKDMQLQKVTDPPGATEIVSGKKNVALSRGTMLELVQAGP